MIGTPLGALAALALLAGLLMVVAGLLQLGRPLRFVSIAVVIGFLTGVSITGDRVARGPIMVRAG
jgi:MFS superfamily sulfate permease-like transporter